MILQIFLSNITLFYAQTSLLLRTYVLYNSRCLDECTLGLNNLDLATTVKAGDYYGNNS